MPAGTPRGFNLQNFGMNGMPMPMNGGSFAPFFPGMPLDPRNQNGAGGPMRRGGRQNGSNRSGPYDRQGGNQRFGRDGGRLSPPPANRRGGSAAGGRGWDGAAGGAAVGPREAVQGRILKSYEDLDAVAGGGSGELNY
jgi:hypothetical protein